MVGRNDAHAGNGPVPSHTRLPGTLQVLHRDDGRMDDAVRPAPEGLQVTLPSEKNADIQIAL